MSEGFSNTYEICSVCFWEDDGIQANNPDYEGGANGPSLQQARLTYNEMGAMEKGFIKHVRPPLPEELPD
ncbi:hydrolase [Hymenobacter sp. DH14]|uniref:Hydrolase n=2 Tax=Hymenobacter cyanobacteriorum TaxID=2926463 RepID=A0A9X1VIC6_9BACT|nr:hydrolase [Hymenobacter cyanobacteriorum]